jgi:thiol-disulfide isomerase/thioredoxin
MKKILNPVIVNGRNIVTGIGIVIGIGIGIVWLPSCDIIEEPYLVPVGSNDTTGPEENVRKVLLEDFTGQKCPNCPEAAEIGHSLQTTYGEQVVIIAIHSGNFAIPDASGDFTADFRTANGTELDQFFGIYQYGYPMGMINRTDYSGFPVVLKDNWQSAVEIQLAMEPQADINITNTYNSSTHKLDCSLESEFLEDLDGTYNICVFIIESGIISPQQTEGGVITDYEHDHMLRTAMNGTWGDLVGSNGQAVSGNKLINSYSFTLPAEWNAENCAVVAYIYNTETLEVLQAEEEAIVVSR